VVGHVWEQFRLPFYVGSHEILWSPANMGPLAVRNQVLTIHDLSPLENPGWYSPFFSYWYRLVLPQLARRVRMVTAPSQYVRRKVLHFFKLEDARVEVVPGGVDPKRFHPGVAASKGMPDRYILFVGTLQPRKNLYTLLESWAKISPRHPHVWLVIAETRRYLNR
jgi:glycosyltransferase involved in cell wall biosynthesis